MRKKTELRKQFVVADYSREKILDVKLLHTHDINFPMPPVYLPVNISEMHGLHHKYAIPHGHSIEYHDDRYRLDVTRVKTGENPKDNDTLVVLSVDGKEAYRTMLFQPIPTYRVYMRIAMEHLLVKMIEKANAENETTLSPPSRKLRRFIGVIIGDEAKKHSGIPAFFDSKNLSVTLPDVPAMLQNYIESYDCSYMNHLAYELKGPRSKPVPVIIGLFLGRPDFMKDSTYGKVMERALESAKTSTFLKQNRIELVQSVAEGMHETLERHPWYNAPVDETVSLQSIVENLQTILDALASTPPVLKEVPEDEHPRIAKLTIDRAQDSLIREIRRVMAGWIANIEIN